MQISRTHPLTLGDWVNFLPLTEPNSTDIPGKVKVSQQTDAPKCDQVVITVNNNNNNNIISFSHFLHQCVKRKRKQYFGTKGYRRMDRRVLTDKPDITIKIKEKRNNFLSNACSSTIG